jgi:hypothetical protein
MSNSNQDHDRDSDHARDNSEHANDNGEHERPGSKIAPAPAAGGALTSLAALQTALANVNTAAIIGRTGLPMLLFKSRENNGTWAFGQRRTIPEEGSKWAVNPLTFRYGFICFGDNNKVVGEHLVSVNQPKPLITDMQDTGYPWQEEWAVNLKCISGADAGVEVVFKATTDGAIKAIVLMVDEVRDRLNSGQHDGKIAPIVLLEKGSYQHPKHGPTSYPVLNRIDWMPLDGPAPAPAPEPPPVEQPRRRRVA